MTIAVRSQIQVVSRQAREHGVEIITQMFAFQMVMVRDV